VRDRYDITVIGGGLAGSEAAWQIARRGGHAHLYEMRPIKTTPAHRTDQLAEIVCSKESVPAGGALAVDRGRFSRKITEAIEAEPSISLHREELETIPDSGVVVIASGPLTSPALSDSIRDFCGRQHLFFYDAISPIVDSDSIDRSKVFSASRYGHDAGDYLNCPMDSAQYARFYEELLRAESVELHAFEETRFFEACLPIEEMARRGRDTLRFGPMKPVGLKDPRTGQIPFAAVQLRQEDRMHSSYNMVGFQNHLTFSDQRRILRLIPGLEQAEFLRLGQIHRNTYIDAPQTLDPQLSAKTDPRVFFAGQLAGTEGYIENVATGLVAGINAVQFSRGEPAWIPPEESAMGSLCRYISTPQKDFAPMNINFGLFPPLNGVKRRSVGKNDRKRQIAERALQRFDEFLSGPNRLPQFSGPSDPASCSNAK
jgi:methylenetetrahydrofolate--tRNA-(uracil-5-)-methyltransferase